MGKRIVAVGFGFAFAAIGAAAQTSAPPPDRAAMERALQQADGPKRRILEAARLKAGPAPAAVATPASAPPAAPAHAAAAPAHAVAPAPRLEAPPVQAPETEIVVVVTMPGGIAPVAVPEPARVGSVAAVAPPEAAPPRPRLLDLAPAPPAAELPPPRVLSMVEPELPARTLRRGSRAEVLLDLLIDADGSVKSAAVRTSSNPDLDDAVLDAVRRWRYEPQPAARPHQVRLVVSPPP